MQQYISTILPKDVINYVLLKYYKYNFNGKVLEMKDLGNISITNDSLIYDSKNKLIYFEVIKKSNYSISAHICDIIKHTLKPVKIYTIDSNKYNVDSRVLFIEENNRKSCNVSICNNHLLNLYNETESNIERELNISTRLDNIQYIDSSYIYACDPLVKTITVYSLEGDSFSEISFNTNLRGRYYFYSLFASNEYIYLRAYSYHGIFRRDHLFIYSKNTFKLVKEHVLEIEYQSIIINNDLIYICKKKNCIHIYNALTFEMLHIMHVKGVRLREKDIINIQNNTLFATEGNRIYCSSLL